MAKINWINLLCLLIFNLHCCYGESSCQCSSLKDKDKGFEPVLCENEEMLAHSIVKLVCSEQFTGSDGLAVCYNGGWDQFKLPNCTKSCNVNHFYLNEGNVFKQVLGDDQTESELITHGSVMTIKCSEEGYDLYRNDKRVPEINVTCLHGEFAIEGIDCRPGGSCGMTNLTMNHGILSLNGEVINPLQMSHVNHSSVIEIECAKGYNLIIGNSVEIPAYMKSYITCSNAEFPDVSLECRPGPCNCSDLTAIEKIKNFISFCAENQIFANGKSVEIRCNFGFTQYSWGEKAECNNRNWIIERFPECKAHCDISDIKLEGGTVTTRYPTKEAIIPNGAEAIFECTAEDLVLYHNNVLVGEQMIPCTDGLVDYGTMECKPTKCGKHVDNGYLVHEEDKLDINGEYPEGTKLYFRCDENLKIEDRSGELVTTEPLVQCTKYGHWQPEYYCKE